MGGGGGGRTSARRGVAGRARARARQTRQLLQRRSGGGRRLNMAGARAQQTHNLLRQRQRLVLERLAHSRQRLGHLGVRRLDSRVARRVERRERRARGGAGQGRRRRRAAAHRGLSLHKDRVRAMSKMVGCAVRAVARQAGGGEARGAWRERRARPPVGRGRARRPRLQTAPVKPRFTRRERAAARQHAAAHTHQAAEHTVGRSDVAKHKLINEAKKKKNYY